MQTIKIVRMSGMPVNEQDRDRYKSEWTRLFDKAEKICKMDMLRLQKRMATIEKILNKKYSTVADENLPASSEEWKSLHDKYGPIMVRLRADSSEPILVIYDIEDPVYA